MSDNDAIVSRRGFIRAAAGTTAAATAAAGTASAQSDAYGGYLSDANGYDGTTAEYTDTDSVTVEVGAGNGFGFNLPAIKIAPGTTVTWEWTGEGGAHNVVAEDETFNSGSTQNSGTYEYTFDEAGAYQYYCNPHKGAGMKGVVVVGDNAEGDVAPASEVSYAGGGSGSETTTSSGGGGGGGGGGKPDLGGYLSDANNYGGSVVDKRGSDNVTVKVGAGSGLAFGPAAVHVDNGATVTWEWTGQGGAHNVVNEGGAFDSGSTQSSGTYEYTFEEDGIYQYYCSPHKGSGMLGVVVVGTDYPTVATGGDVGPSDLPSSAKTLGVATLFVMTATLGLAYFFMKYGGDYGEFDE
jgi:halocyanin-like protein